MIHVISARHEFRFKILTIVFFFLAHFLCKNDVEVWLKQVTCEGLRLLTEE
jgi:hypothetical protein